MAETKIQWAEKVWNPVRGCTRISPGCGQGGQGGCYAERLAIRMAGPGQPYERLVESTPSGPRWTGEVRLAPKEVLYQPLHWRKPCRIFVNSMSDLFHEKLDPLDIANIWKVMRAAPQHQYLILTKRAERMREWVVEWIKGGGEILPCVWLGVSVEDQATADERIPVLLQIPAAVRFVSYEPALGPVDFTGEDGEWLLRHPIADGYGYNPKHAAGLSCSVCGDQNTLDWIIVGSESGPRARPMKLEWAESVARQCAEAHIAFFMKQITVDGKKVGDMASFPPSLRVRQFPRVNHAS